jgi:hypothetical protein
MALSSVCLFSLLPVSPLFIIFSVTQGWIIMSMSITADSGVKFNNFNVSEVESTNQAWDQGGFEIDTGHDVTAQDSGSNGDADITTGNQNITAFSGGVDLHAPNYSFTALQEGVENLFHSAPANEGSLNNAQGQDNLSDAADTGINPADESPTTKYTSYLGLENQANIELSYYQSTGSIDSSINIDGGSSAQTNVLEINMSAEDNHGVINPMQSSSADNGTREHAQLASNAYVNSGSSSDSNPEFEFLGFDAGTLAAARTASFNQVAGNVFDDLVAGAREVDEEFSVLTRLGGVIQAFGGGAEVLAGLSATGTVAGSVVGIPAMVHGGDNLWAGSLTAATGESVKPVTVHALEKVGMSSTAAELTNAGLSIGFMAGPTIASRMANSSHVVTESYYPLARSGVGDFVAENTRLQTRSTPEAIKLMFDDSLSATQQQQVINSMNEFVQNPVGKAFYERLLSSDTKIKFTNGSALQDPAVYRPRENAIRINLTRPQDIGSSISHELTHAARVERFNVKPSQYEEYRAFRSQSLYEQSGTRPTLEQRREIWGQVQQRYSDLPIGKNPFGSN